MWRMQMTVQYNGGDNYTIFTEHDIFILSKDTIDEIQSYDFIIGGPTDSVEELRDKIEDLETNIEDLEDKIRDLEGKIEDLEEALYGR
jgi:archaellum component FlaC